MEKLCFRSATVRDLDHIMRMEAAGFAAELRESRTVYARRIAAFAAGALIASVGGDDVGCFFSEIWRAGALPQADHFRLGHDIVERHDAQRGDTLYISSLTLAPDWRGQGLGAPLFAGGIAHVARAHPQLSSVLLLVSSAWHPARRIYHAAGFAEIARFDGFFATAAAAPADGIVMRRAIQRTPSVGPTSASGDASGGTHELEVNSRLCPSPSPKLQPQPQLALADEQ